jgi:hypothetical protein
VSQLHSPLVAEGQLLTAACHSDASSRAALTAWDKEALKRWDMLHQEQQKMLQSWQVPCFFETHDAAHLKKQERVFDVLYGLLE